VQVGHGIEQLRSQQVAVAAPGADRAVRDAGGVRDRHQLGLAERLGEIPHQQHGGLVADQQQPAARVVGAQFAQQRTQPQQHVGPGLAARRPVVELAEPGAARVLVGQPGPHAAAGVQIQHAQFAVAQPLVDDRGDAEAGQRELRGLPGPQVRRHDRHLRPLVAVQLAEPGADRLGLLAAGPGQRHVGIAFRDVDQFQPAGLGVLRDHVAGALAMTDDAKPLRLLHAGFLTRTARGLPRPRIDN
jgi:hypothetical protein